MRAALTALFWSLVALITLSPLLVVALLFDPPLYQNTAFLIVFAPGLIGAILLGPAWYYARRRLLRQEGFKASGQASESQSRTAR